MLGAQQGAADGYDDLDESVGEEEVFEGEVIGDEAPYGNSSSSRLPAVPFERYERLLQQALSAQAFCVLSKPLSRHVVIYVVNRALRSGAVRQVDWAQDGYKLYITRTIKDASGARTDVTRTNYKPWRAVYEVGPRS